MMNASECVTGDPGRARWAGREGRPPRLLLVALLAGALIAGAGCDIFDLDTTRLVAGTVIHHPAVPGGQSELTSASVFFGEREPGVDPFLFPPVGIVGADVQLTIFAQGDSIRDVPLSGLGDGSYLSTSNSDSSLLYQSGASYRVEVNELGEVFEVDVEQAPAPEPPQGIHDGHPAGEPLTISRSQVRIGFVEVLRLDGGSASLTYSTLPADTQEVLAVVADPRPHQASTLEIPGDAFPEPGDYAVILTTAVRGVPDFNLYSGSGVLVGAGEARLLRVD